MSLAPTLPVIPRNIIEFEANALQLFKVSDEHSALCRCFDLIFATHYINESRKSSQRYFSFNSKWYRLYYVYWLYSMERTFSLTSFRGKSIDWVLHFCLACFKKPRTNALLLPLSLTTVAQAPALVLGRYLTFYFCECYTYSGVFFVAIFYIFS